MQNQTEETSGEETWIDRLVLRYIRNDGPGLALVLIQNREVVYEAAYGLANLARATPVTVNTQFHIASCGKQFTGLGIMMLQEEGKLQYDDHIGKHIPELSRFPAAVTIRKLLHHLSGVYDLYSDEAAPKLLALSANPTNDDVIRAYMSLGCPTDSPGTFVYSNSGYDLLGCVIERVTGQRYRDFFAARVFGPLGMRATFSCPGQPGADHATGYEVDRGTFVPNPGTPFDNVCGSGSFWSTATDLCLYDNALETNQLVTAASMREALTPGVGNWWRKTEYGFGWFVLDGYADHSGAWNGFRSYARRYYDSQAIYALSNNAGIEPAEIVDEIAREYPAQTS